MKKLNKIIAYVVVISMICGLTACSQKIDDQTVETEDQKVTITETAKETVKETAETKATETKATEIKIFDNHNIFCTAKNLW